MSTEIAFSSSSDSSDCGKYDVFLSFRGEDTRHGFTGHLYDRLKDAGFHTFLDDDGIERGEDIKSKLEKAIQESRISIVVLSKSFASSTWCLEELVMILRRRRAGKLAILPIFYEVDPSDLRKQTGTFADAFLKHENRFQKECDGSGTEKIGRWRKALAEVADLAGTVYRSQVYRYEYDCIKTIVNEVQNKWRRTCFTDDYLVGINPDVRKISMWLNDKSSAVGILVICGIGGIGKTTIAKKVYNINHTRFDSSSFISIRDFSKRPNGLLHLQKKILLDIQGPHKMEKPRSIDDGWHHIMHALRFKGPFLLVLDDVDQPSQLDEILRMKCWLSTGSKIIITTRRLDMPKAHEAYETYKVKKLSHDKALELFSYHAFGQLYPKESYKEQAKLFVAHCDGLPLALKVLGSSLSHKELDHWECQLKKLKEFPNKNITKTLRISFDSLEDDNDRNIFLDIACFFVGKDKDFTTAILKGSDIHVVIGIQNLLDGCLLEIDKQNKLVMHQLIQDMGKQIVRENSENYPEKRIRLWNHKDSMNVLRCKTGTEAIEGLILSLKSSNTENAFETDAFKRMQKLRILQLNYARLNGYYKVLTKNLKWLRWHGFPMNSIPNDFPLDGLVALDMRHSFLRHLWIGTKFLGSLKFLNFSHSPLLVRTTDFSLISNLEKLILKDCPKLVEIHSSLSNLKKLIFLNVKDCKCLIKLPRNIGMVKSLEQLIISGCSSLVVVPDELKKMSSLKIFEADGIAIDRILSPTEETSSWITSILPWLSKKKLIREISWTFLPNSLVSLSLEGCNLLETDFSVEFSNLSMLKQLHLGSNLFHSLPDCIKDLTNLKKLNVDCCQRLRLVEYSSTQLEFLSMTDCHSLEKIGERTLISRCLCALNTSGCERLSQIQHYFRVKPIREMDAEALNTIGFSHFDSMADGKVRYNGGIFWTSFSGNEVPEWFSYKSMTSYISLVVPPNVRVRGINLCLAYTISLSDDSCRISVRVMNESKNLAAPYILYGSSISEQNKPTIWLSYWLFGILFEGGDRMKVSFYIEQGNCQIKECGAHLLYDEEKEEEIQNIKSLLLLGLHEYGYDCVQVTNDHAIFSIAFEGREVPEWFSYKNMSSVVSFVVPSRPNIRIRGFYLSFAYTASYDDCLPWLSFSTQVIINKRKNFNAHSDFRDYFQESRVCLGCWIYGIVIEDGDHMEVSFHIENGNYLIRECGIHLLYDEEETKEMHSLKLLFPSEFFDICLDTDKFNSLVPTAFFDGDFRIWIEGRHLYPVEEVEMEEVPWTPLTEEKEKLKEVNDAAADVEEKEPKEVAGDDDMEEGEQKGADDGVKVEEPEEVDDDEDDAEVKPEVVTRPVKKRKVTEFCSHCLLISINDPESRSLQSGRWWREAFWIESSCKSPEEFPFVFFIYAWMYMLDGW